MAAIKRSLQQDVFKSNEETLYAAVNVAKQGTGKKKKATFLCISVTKEKPYQVRIHKIEKSERDAYKRKHVWPLTELKIVDGKETDGETQDFELHFEKCYRWVASRVPDKNEFISAIWTLSERYITGKKPSFLNVNPDVVGGEVTSRLRSNTGQSNHSLDNNVNGSVDDYQELTPREEKDLERMLSQFEHALSNVDHFTDQLSSELQELEYLNISSLMGSETQARDLIGLIDHGVNQLDILQGRLDCYTALLESVNEQMGLMEFKDTKLEVERINNKKILEEVRFIVGKLDISKRHIRSLKEADLYNPMGIAECVSAAKILLEASETEFNPGITELKAVRDQFDSMEKLKMEFAERFFNHLDKFISQHSMSDRHAIKSSSVELMLPSHDAVHDDFLPYVELMGWLKNLDHGKYVEIRQHYQESFAKLYEREFKEFIETAKVRATAKVKASKSGLHEDSMAKRVSKMSMKNKDSGSLKRSTSGESINSIGSTMSLDTSRHDNHQFEQVFDAILSELEPFVQTENKFCESYFHLGKGNMESVDGAAFSRARQPHEKIHDEQRELMTKLFGFLDAEMQALIVFGEKLDTHNTMYMVVRINTQGSHLMTSQTTGAPPSFLGTMFGSWLIFTKRLFDKFITALCRMIEEARVHKKSKCGVIPFVKKFEEFAKTAESYFRASERRSDIDKAYVRLVQTVFTNIERIASEHEKSPEEVIRFENYHYMFGILSSLKNSGLDAEKKEAKMRYNDAMTQYVVNRLGRPMEKLSNFFEGVENCIASGVRMEDVGYQIAFNQQELKNIIKEYPPKEIKKGLETLYKKVEKHVSEEGLAQVVWHNMQEEFVRQYERFQELIAKCYPGSNCVLYVKLEEILEFFSSIAQTH